jgi:hypothetical protein
MQDQAAHVWRGVQGSNTCVNSLRFSSCSSSPLLYCLVQAGAILQHSCDGFLRQLFGSAAGFECELDELRLLIPGKTYFHALSR